MATILPGLLGVVLYLSGAACSSRGSCASRARSAHGPHQSPWRRRSPMPGWFGRSCSPTALDLGLFRVAALVTLTMVVLILASSWGRPLDNLFVVLFPAAALSLTLALVFEVHYLPPESSARVLPRTRTARRARLRRAVRRRMPVAARRLAGRPIAQSPRLALLASLHARCRPWSTCSSNCCGPGSSADAGDRLGLPLPRRHVRAARRASYGAVDRELVGVRDPARGSLASRLAGRTAIRWTLAGFTMLMLAYFGGKLVIEVILD